MIAKIENACAAILLVGVVILVGVASVARAVGSPIIWSIEIAQLLFLWLCIISIDLALQQDRHFGIGLVLDHLPATGRRIMEIVNLVVMIGLLVYLIRYAWTNMILMHPRLDGALQLPGSWFHASMVIGFALLIRTMCVKLVGCLRGTGDS